MARVKGARKLKSIDDLILINQEKIQACEDELTELKAERKSLLEQKDEQSLAALLKSIKDSGLTIAEAQEILVKNKVGD